MISLRLCWAAPAWPRFTTCRNRGCSNCCSHPQLAKDIASELGIPLSSHSTSNFKNGETGCIIHDSVRDCDVFIIQSTCNPCPNEYLMELLVMTDALNICDGIGKLKKRLLTQRRAA